MHEGDVQGLLAMRRGRSGSGLVRSVSERGTRVSSHLLASSGDPSIIIHVCVKPRRKSFYDLRSRAALLTQLLAYCMVHSLAFWMAPFSSFFQWSATASSRGSSQLGADIKAWIDKRT